MSFAATLPRYLTPRREKLFGDGRPRPGTAELGKHGLG